jgi:hypothetical protein
MRRSGDVRERHEQGSFYLTPTENAPAGTRADGWATHARRACAERAAAATRDGDTDSIVALEILYKTLFRASATQGWQANEGALSTPHRDPVGQGAVPTRARPTGGSVVRSEST